jgi:hypothetical protein
VLAWAAAGLLVPPSFLVAFAVFSLAHGTLLGHVALTLALALGVAWPGGLLLLAFDGVPWRVLWPTLLASVALNVMLYALAGAAVRQLRARPPATVRLRRRRPFWWRRAA